LARYLIGGQQDRKEVIDQFDKAIQAVENTRTYLPNRWLWCFLYQQQLKLMDEPARKAAKQKALARLKVAEAEVSASNTVFRRLITQDIDYWTKHP